MRSGLAVRIERCLGKGDAGSVPEGPDSALPHVQDARRRIAELFARAKRSGCGKDGEPQQWDPSKASSSGKVALDLAPPDKVASELAPTDKESSSPSNLSVTGSVSSEGDTVCTPDPSHWKATSNQAAARFRVQGLPASDYTFEDEEPWEDGFISPLQKVGCSTTPSDVPDSLRKLRELLANDKARQRAKEMFHGRQCVVINAGGSPTKPNEGSHREPPFNSSSPTEPISSSSRTKLIHTMSPEELKGEGMLLSTMQAFDEVQTEENPLAPTGVAAMDNWLAALEADAAEGEALCRRLFDKDDYEMVTLPSEDKMDECNECNNELDNTELDNTECRVISQVEPEAKPEPEVCGAKPGRSASSSSMNTHLANIQGFKCKCSIASGMGSASCLEQLSTYQHRGLHSVLHGPSGVEMKIREVRARLHAAMWGLPRQLIIIQMVVWMACNASIALQSGS